MRVAMVLTFQGKHREDSFRSLCQTKGECVRAYTREEARQPNRAFCLGKWVSIMNLTPTRN